MKLLKGMLAGVVISVTLGTAHAQDVDRQMTDDARCLMAAVLLSERAPEEMKAGLQIQIFYFLGRISGRDAKIDEAAVVQREIPNVLAIGAAKEVQRCSAAIVSATQELVRLADGSDKK